MSTKESKKNLVNWFLVTILLTTAWLLLSTVLAETNTLEFGNVADNRDFETETPHATQLWEPYLTTSSWPTLHHDPYNSDFSPVENQAFDQRGAPFLFWYELGSEIGEDGKPTGAGGAITTMMQSIDDASGLVFVPTGKPGQPSLHAFYTQAENGHAAGDVAWTSSQFKNEEGEQLDVTAISSNPLLGSAGSVYIGDHRYLWAFQRQGGLKWYAPIPHEAGSEGVPFVSSVFTRQVYLPDGSSIAGVGGITTRGELTIFDTKDGTPLVDYYLLPGVLRPEPTDGKEIENPIATCLWRDVEGNPMVAEELIDAYIQGNAGVGVPVSNTPLVLPDPYNERTTRVYVPALLAPTTEKPSEDLEYDLKLFRIDVTFSDDGRATAAEPAHWSEPLPDGTLPGVVPDGGGSATSPTASADGQVIFVGDRRGILYGFDADSGQKLWELQVGTMWRSITATWPDTEEIYVVAENMLKKFVLGEGHVPRQDDPDAVQDFQILARTLVPYHPMFSRIGIAGGFAVATPNRIYTSAILGYELTDEVELAVWPVRSVVVVLDRDLNILNWFPLPDGSETGVMLDQNGNLYVTFASILTSLTHCLWRQGLFQNILPEPLRPSGGIAVFRAEPREVVQRSHLSP